MKNSRNNRLLLLTVKENSTLHKTVFQQFLDKSWALSTYCTDAKHFFKFIFWILSNEIERIASQFPDFLHSFLLKRGFIKIKQKSLTKNHSHPCLVKWDFSEIFKPQLYVFPQKLVFRNVERKNANVVGGSLKWLPYFCAFYCFLLLYKCWKEAGGRQDSHSVGYFFFLFTSFHLWKKCRFCHNWKTHQQRSDERTDKWPLCFGFLCLSFFKYRIYLCLLLILDFFEVFRVAESFLRIFDNMSKNWQYLRST